MKIIRIIILTVAIVLLTGCDNKRKETENAANPSTESAIKRPNEDSEKTNNTGLPVILDFSATWCGPCKMIAPYVHELAETNKDVVMFTFIDIDENSSLAEEYKVEAVPTFVLLDADGREIDRLTGADKTGLDNLVSTARSIKR